MAKPTAPREDSNDEIAKRLDLLRRAYSMAQGRERPLNQAEFARLCDLGDQAFNNFVKARGRVGLDSAMKIRARTGVSLDFIYFNNRNGLPREIADAIDAIEQQERPAKRAG